MLMGEEKNLNILYNMINKKYLEQAARIRKDFININSDLEIVSTELFSLKDRLEKYKTDLKSLTDDPDISNDVLNSNAMDILNDMAREQDTINNIYKPINEKMENLKKEEIELFSNLKKEYPSLSDTELVKKITNFIGGM